MAVLSKTRGRFTAALTASLLLLSIAPGQTPGDLLHIGRGCPTSKGKPVKLTADSFPKIGSPFELSLSGSQPHSRAMLFFGGSQPNLDLTPLGAPGCTLLSSTEVGVPMLTDANGRAGLNLTIPNSPVFLGMSFHNQYMVADPVNRFGVVTSNGVKGTVGNKMACGATSAFSVWGAGHVSEGPRTLLEFTYTDTNVGSCFKRGFNISGFRAPERGLYYFHFDAVKDAFAVGMTEDDVSVQFYKWKSSGPTSMVAYAMSGQGTGKRGTMATSFALRLEKHDWISAYVISDGLPGKEPKRSLMSYHFSGFRLDTPVAFSVQGNSHQSSGSIHANTTLWYTSQLWHPNWSASTFTAPKTGYYFFSMSGVKDSYITNGTTDDVYMQLWRDYGNGPKLLGQAMSGEGGGGRGSMATTLITWLNVGDRVYSTATADGGKYRYLLKYELTGFLVEHGADLAASSAGHVSSGSPTTMNYPYVQTANGASMTGGTTWKVPKSGYYFLGFSGVRDAFSFGGTTDDVFAQFYVNNVALAGGGAWSGQGSGMRGTMVYSTVRWLNQDDLLTTRASSDGGKTRYLIKYEMTATRLCN